MWSRVANLLLKVQQQKSDSKWKSEMSFKNQLAVFIEWITDMKVAGERELNNNRLEEAKKHT